MPYQFCRTAISGGRQVSYGSAGAQAGVHTRATTVRLQPLGMACRAHHWDRTCPGANGTLSRIEYAFRSARTIDLKVRLIYHRREDRMRATSSCAARLRRRVVHRQGSRPDPLRRPRARGSRTTTTLSRRSRQALSGRPPRSQTQANRLRSDDPQLWQCHRSVSHGAVEDSVHSRLVALPWSLETGQHRAFDAHGDLVGAIRLYDFRPVLEFLV